MVFMVSICVCVCLAMGESSLVINQHNVRGLSLDYVKGCASNAYWHKFVVENGGNLEKEEVLRGVLEFVHPVDLVPVKYSVAGKDAWFLGRNCSLAIVKLVETSLGPIKLKNNLQVNVEIEMCHIPVNELKVNMQYHLKQAIEKRHTRSEEGCIDLSSFHREPELYEILFCPLSRPRFLVYVLTILKKILEVSSIDLSSNEIEDLKPLEILHSFKGLTSLNLSNNKILDTTQIELLGRMIPSLEEINLNENPLCSAFTTDKEYTQWVKKCLPSIKVLDGLQLNYGVPNQKFWLCDNSSWPVINEFVKQYFTLYDFSRKTLEAMYGANAVFSMTCHHSPGYFLESTLRPYRRKSTVLLKVHKENKIVQWYHWKSAGIVGFLCELPESQHDYSSFKIDVPRLEESSLFGGIPKQYMPGVQLLRGGASDKEKGENCIGILEKDQVNYFLEEKDRVFAITPKGAHIVVIVSGIFKDVQSASETRSFNRTFVLQKIGEDEYKIANDMYHVTNACQEEVENCWLTETNREIAKASYLCLKEERKKNMCQHLAQLTNLNLGYSKRCLEEGCWNLWKALEIFLSKYRTSSIPPGAFIGEEE